MPESCMRSFPKPD